MIALPQRLNDCLLRLVVLLLSVTQSRAASVEWHFASDLNGSYDVLATVYGDDNAGIAGFDIQLDGLGFFGIDPSEIQWRPNSSSWFAKSEVSHKSDSFTVTSRQDLSSQVTLGVGAGQTVRLGTLELPSIGVSFPNFRGTRASLFDEDLPADLAGSDWDAVTLASRRVSAMHWGGDVFEDFSVRIIPGRANVEFGSVGLAGDRLRDFVTLINHGFAGGTLEFLTADISGPDASSFRTTAQAPFTLSTRGPASVFDVILDPQRTGQLDASIDFIYRTVPGFPGGQPIFDSFSIDLSATVASAPGDFNGDGLVNAADYVAWRDNIGADDGTLFNDTVGGQIGEVQYELWREHYGSSATAVTSQVPESSTVYMTLFALLTMASHRNQH